jgi:hypothetical protein
MKMKFYAIIFLAIVNSLSTMATQANESLFSNSRFCSHSIPFGTNPIKLRSKVRCHGKMYELQYDARGHLRYFLIEKKNANKK